MQFTHTFESRTLSSPANPDLYMHIYATLEVEGKHMDLTLTGEHGEPLEQKSLPASDIQMINKWCMECAQDAYEYAVEQDLLAVELSQEGAG